MTVEPEVLHDTDGITYIIVGVVCDDCGGDGRCRFGCTDRDPRHVCNICGGEGEVEDYVPVP